MPNLYSGVAVLALVRRHDPATQVVRHELHAVADAQHGQTKLQYGRVRIWRVRVIHRAGPTGKDDANRVKRLNRIERCSTRQNDGEDLGLAHATRNQLRVLRAKVEDDNC